MNKKKKTNNKKINYDTEFQQNRFEHRTSFYFFSHGKEKVSEEREIILIKNKSIFTELFYQFICCRFRKTMKLNPGVLSSFHILKIYF